MDRSSWIEPAAIACLALIVSLGLVAAFTHALPDDKLRAGLPGDPRSIDWGDKNAYLKCQAAIDGNEAWPRLPEAACNAVLMCAAEAKLSQQQHLRLVDQARQLAGCGVP